MSTVRSRPGWRDRSDTWMWVRWWRARITGYLHLQRWVAAARTAWALVAVAFALVIDGLVLGPARRRALAWTRWPG